MSAEDGSIAILRLSGAVDVRTVDATHRALIDALSANDAVAVDTDGITETDLTLVQLLESARLTAKAQGKRFSLTAPAVGPLHETLLRGGFLAVAASAQFWLHQGD